MFRNRKGFTLIELLVVIGILAVLLAITLIAVNPGQNLEDADDTKRRSDVNAILNAVNQYMVDNNGDAPTNVPTGLANAAIIGDGAGQVDICADIIPTYIAAVPQDPDNNNGADITNCVGYSSGYTIYKDNNRITVNALNANTPPIIVTR
ncbi:MAG: hypothetical protein US54_C0062G0005 [Candidatus Roizmanbacteria bacterium GW2011_GWA2_37_7]|uniref:Uncharacterized protein n=1 Tax=Candidatus Roizmanbacteria bacterium GW2011_GWA2_37_7 TaxID=1618481 RepID=A0A0G0HDK7_9BACT|nr:MAG: hypothetical protein US54_C0062G0005 [Candidatus Roizmanbacteria bacterium GW2011_GWA2_37_7]